MRREWDAPGVVAEGELAGVPAPVVELVRASRLLGGDEFLVLQGGGNSSAKQGRRLWVKASGHDMGSIGPAGLPAVDRDALDALMEREELSDTEMIEGYRAALLDPSAPSPTIEAVVHNLVPEAFVLHTHADAIVTLTNTPCWEALVREALGGEVLLAPFLMPGFGLAVHLGRELAAREGLPRAIVLRHHGLFTWGATAREAFELHLELVERAEALVRERTGVVFAEDEDERSVWSTEEDAPAALRELVERASAYLGAPAVGLATTSPQVEAFLARPDLAEVTQRGTASLEHVIHTKRVPLLGTDLEAFASEYRAYVAEHRARANGPVTELDPMPRVALVEGLGLVALAPNEKRARVARDIYRHTMRVIEAAEALGGYETVTPAQAFDIEYWELEQAKLR